MPNLFMSFLIELSPALAAPGAFETSAHAACATVLEVSPTRGQDGSQLVVVGLDDARLATGTLVWKVHVPDAGVGASALVWGDLVSVDLSSATVAHGAPSGGVLADGELKFVERLCASNNQKDVPAATLSLSQTERSALLGRKGGAQ